MEVVFVMCLQFQISGNTLWSEMRLRLRPVTTTYKVNAPGTRSLVLRGFTQYVSLFISLHSLYTIYTHTVPSML